jgi:hypothetical protein
MGPTDRRWESIFMERRFTGVTPRVETRGFTLPGSGLLGPVADQLGESGAIRPSGFAGSW